MKLPASNDEKLSPVKPEFVMYGYWIPGQIRGTTTSRTRSGETIYMVEDGQYTKMVTRSGIGKYYVGKMSQFDPNAWDSYAQAPGGAYNVQLPYESVLDGNHGRKL